MSGAEVLAVLGCVAALVSAYHNGSSIVESIKAKRRRRNAPQPTALLEQSLQRGPTEVVRARDDGVNRYGPAFALGDDVAIRALKDIEVDLLRAIVDHLGRAQQDDGIVDFSVVVDTSDLGRIKALTVLHELYMRVAQAQPIQLSPFSIQHPQLQNATESPTDVATQKTTSPVSLLQEGKRWLSSLRRRSIRDRRGSIDDRQVEDMSDRVPTRPERRGPRNQISSSLPSSIPPVPLSSLEANPWVEEPSNPSAGDIPFTSPRTDGSSTPSRPSSPLSPGSQSRPEPIGPATEYGGYCKGAYYLQRGFPRDALKIANQSVSMQAENHYWKCCSKKCAFDGPAIKTAGGWRFDGDVMHCRGVEGVEYRWSFLAKSHVSLGRVKGGWTHHTFKCFMCHLQGDRRSTFPGIWAFLNHTASHRGDRVGDTLVQGPLVLSAEAVKSVSGNDAKHFDVNILPVERVAPPSPAPTEADAVSHMADDGSQIHPERNDSWYRAQDDTASTVLDPWKE